MYAEGRSLGGPSQLVWEAGFPLTLNGQAASDLDGEDREAGEKGVWLGQLQPAKASKGWI